MLIKHESEYVLRSFWRLEVKCENDLFIYLTSLKIIVIQKVWADKKADCWDITDEGKGFKGCMKRPVENARKKNLNFLSKIEDCSLAHWIIFTAYYCRLVMPNLKVS